MKKEFNAQNALTEAVKANDVAKAAKLLKSGAKADSHLLALAIDDKMAIPQRRGSVGSDDLAMAKLLVKHGATVSGNDFEPVVAAFATPSILGMFFVFDQPGCDLDAALKVYKAAPQYAGPEHADGKQFMQSYIAARRKFAQDAPERHKPGKSPRP